MYILIMRRGRLFDSSVCSCLHMDPYVVTFYLYLGLGIGVIGPAFDISIVIWVPYSLLWASLESRKRFDFTSFIYIEYIEGIPRIIPIEAI